jgi:WD40 repeat protein
MDAYSLTCGLQWISDVKFSPDGATLAVGSHDNMIYLYDVQKGFKLRKKLKAHSSYITHMDFSSDSRCFGDLVCVFVFCGAFSRNNVHNICFCVY